MAWFLPVAGKTDYVKWHVFCRQRGLCIMLNGTVFAQNRKTDYVKWHGFCREGTGPDYVKSDMRAGIR